MSENVSGRIDGEYKMEIEEKNGKHGMHGFSGSMTIKKFDSSDLKIMDVEDPFSLVEM